MGKGAAKNERPSRTRRAPGRFAVRSARIGTGAQAALFASLGRFRSDPDRPVPLRPLSLALLVLAGCGGRGPSEPAGLGAQVYATTCVTCHQRDGRGVPGAYPPLAGTPWVTGDEGRLVRLVLHGLRGPIDVDGVRYSNVMTAHGFLSDDQIAAVVTYVRSEFGNAAGPVTPEQVAAVRAAEPRRGPWTAAELETRTGIPAAPAP